MKTRIVILIAITATLLSGFTISNVCESFFPQAAGSSWEMTTYDGKDKISSRVKQKLVSVSDAGDGVEATVNSEIYDNKDKLLSSGDIKMRCSGDKFYMDMSGMFAGMQQQGMEGAEVSMENQYMEFPSNPVAGMTLPDASPTMTMSVNGMQVMQMTINITNRKVEGNETVTTPAGTYDCVKFSEDIEVKTMMMKRKSHSITWMARNYGAVKTESYDEKGKLESKSLLTAFSN